MHTRISQADLHQPTSVGYPVHGSGSQGPENCHPRQDNCWKTWVSDHTTPNSSLTREGHGDITLPSVGGGCPPVTFSWASELHEPTWKLMVPTSSRVTCGSGDGVSAWQPVQAVSPDNSPGQSNGSWSLLLPHSWEHVDGGRSQGPTLCRVSEWSVPCSTVMSFISLACRGTPPKAQRASWPEALDSRHRKWASWPSLSCTSCRGSRMVTWGAAPREVWHQPQQLGCSTVRSASQFWSLPLAPHPNFCR